MDTAERLIETTQALLWERGYVGTSPRAIQRAAQAGQGSMYHHFSGKRALALAAVRRSAAQLRALGDAELSRGDSAAGAITGYLRRDRDVLRGCRIGRLAQDPEIVADAELQAPVAETFRWLRGRLAEVIADGQASGELVADIDPADVAAAIAATLQGGYVLARAEGDPAPFHRAIDGVLQLLSCARVQGRS